MSNMILPLILVQVAAVVAIVFFLRTLLHKQLELGMNRIKRIDADNIRKEAELNEKLEFLKKEYQKKIGEAEQKAAALVEAAKEEARAVREDERQRAKDEARKIISGAMQQKEKALEEMEEEIFSEGLDLAERIVGMMFSDEDLKELKKKVSREVIDVLARSERVRELLEKNDGIEVLSGEPLSEADRQHLEKVFAELYGGKKMIFNTDKDMLGGLMLKAGGEIVDGSIAYRIRKAAMEIRENKGKEGIEKGK